MSVEVSLFAKSVEVSPFAKTPLSVEVSLFAKSVQVRFHPLAESSHYEQGRSLAQILVYRPELG